MNRAPTWVRPAANRYSYVVTRSRPYPARRSREVVAVSGWRLGTAERQADAMSSHPYQRKEPGRKAGLRL